ncbi:unnamed protein product [Linum tenue]|uniref:Uncharacterized protein n=1 Tax=Linum tenue TaxID=586396 RepID=A0AAV0PWJ7_9ROSI|nr:unnamed protein product [Linum tenue]
MHAQRGECFKSSTTESPPPSSTGWRTSPRASSACRLTRSSRRPGHPTGSPATAWPGSPLFSQSSCGRKASPWLAPRWSISTQFGLIITPDSGTYITAPFSKLFFPPFQLLVFFFFLFCIYHGENYFFLFSTRVSFLHHITTSSLRASLFME